MNDARAGLERLAALIQERNAVELEMASLLGQPASAGNLGEFIAAAIFDIERAESAVNPGHDGLFRSGPNAGKSVNVKLYSQDAGLLDISPHPADYYLVLTGPKPKAGAGVRSLPRRIDSVYLFDISALKSDLQARGVGIGVATSVKKAAWEAARIYPPTPGAVLALSDLQVELLQLFRSADDQP